MSTREDVHQERENAAATPPPEARPIVKGFHATRRSTYKAIVSVFALFTFFVMVFVALEVPNLLILSILGIAEIAMLVMLGMAYGKMAMQFYKALVAGSVMFTLVMIVFVSVAFPNQAILALLSFCEAAMLILGYRLFTPQPAQTESLDYVHAKQVILPTKINPVTNTLESHSTMAILLGAGIKKDTETNPTTLPLSRDLLRYIVGTLAISFAVLSLALILSQHGYVDDFLIIFPFTAFFPFSYLAYATFQREVRLKRLKRDFDLLGIPWDGELVRQVHGFGYFAPHIALAMMFTVIGLSLFTAGESRYVTVLGEITLNADALRPLQFGFLGSYLFAVQLIYRRYSTYDLGPIVYLYSALTILAGLIFNYVAFGAVHSIAAAGASGDTPANGTILGEGLEAILAFALGFFPLLAVQWMNGIITKALGTRQVRSEDLPLTLLDGISTMHETRLRDFGIDTIQNLAAVDLRLLLLNTPFTAQEVTDWVDQAILYLYLETNEIQSFQQAQVRTVSDFREMWKPMYDRELPMPLKNNPPTAGNKDIDSLRKDKANQLIANTQPEYLDLLYEATNYGPNLHYVVHYWQNADRQRKIEYLFNTLPERNSPKYNFILGQTFLEYAHFDKNLDEIADKKALPATMKALNDIWTDIEKFPIDSEKTMTLNTSLGYAGLAYLMQYSASKDNLEARMECLAKAEKYYKQAIKLNEDFMAQIGKMRQVNIVAEYEVVATAVKSLHDKQEAVEKTTEPPKKLEREEDVVKFSESAHNYLVQLEEALQKCDVPTDPVILQKREWIIEQGKQFSAIHEAATPAKKLEAIKKMPKGWGGMDEQVDDPTPEPNGHVKKQRRGFGIGRKKPTP